MYKRNLLTILTTVSLISSLLITTSEAISEQTSSSNSPQNQVNLSVKQGEELIIKEIESKLIGIDSELANKADSLSNLIKQQRQQANQLYELENGFDQLLVTNYINWKTDEATTTMLLGSNDSFRNLVYLNSIVADNNENLNSNALALDDLSTQTANLNAEIINLHKQKQDLLEQKTEMQKQMQLVIVANKQAESKTGFRAFTSSQQVAPQQPVTEVAQSVTTVATATKPLTTPGTIYFSGVEPDAIGHGVGLSQWGAYGAAQKGMTASQILQFYYTNTRIENRPGLTINVSGYGVMSVEDYVSGLGEVPSKACADINQVTRWNYFANQNGWAQNDPRRSKYVIDNPSTPWDCWPEESIKAQVIAARSYGVTSSQPICTSSQCQVYYGNKDKAWAALETKDQYLISNGPTHKDDFVRAYYSAYNNNGWGTADNDTVWSDRSGNGSVYSYLRAVNDTNTTYNYVYTHSTWRTNAYTIAQLNDMLIWCGQNCNSKSWFQPNVVDKIGTLKSLIVNKDPSGRVKKVFLTGTNNVTVSIAGWYFKDIFNIWVSKVLPSGEDDYMNSVTFSINTV